MDNMEALMTALNGHSVTDDQGEVPVEQTSVEEPVAQETSTVDEPQAAVEAQPAAQADPETPELAEDETGKRYVPQERFDKVYGKLKAYERGELQPKVAPQVTQPIQQPVAPKPIQAESKADAMETELLYATLPQFNPHDPANYNQDLDELGAEIYRASQVVDPKTKALVPTITKLEAARRAIAKAKKFTANQIAIAAEARQVKSLQADQGITSRVTSRGQSDQIDPNKMTLEQMEEFLKSNGQW